jgi:hypothetical protein
MNGVAGAGAGAAAAAIANATKASGAIVKLPPEEFQKILNRSEDAIVVLAEGGVFNKHFKHLMSYRGLFFYTQAQQPLRGPSGTEYISAKTIWIPG